MKFIKCPMCGKISMYNGSYCKECYENYVDMNITERDFVKPLFEKKFLDFQDEKRYKK